MALKLAHVDTDGQTGDYWRLLRIDRSVDSKTARIVMGLYKDEATRRVDGRMPMRTEEFGVTPAEYDALFAESVLKTLNVTDTIKAYEHMKTLEAPFDFKNSSTDVL